MDAVESLKQMKLTYITAATDIENLKEPIEMIIQLTELLQQALDEKRADSDASFQKFLVEDVGPQMTKRSLKERSNDENYLKVLWNLLKVLMRAFYEELAAKRYNVKFMQEMMLLFQHDSQLHNFHYQLSGEDLRVMTVNAQPWRQELKLGDKVDIKVRADERSKLRGWVQCVITEVGTEGPKENFLTAQAINSIPSYDSVIHRHALQMTEFEGRTKDNYAWRVDQPQVWQEIDAHDKDNWKKATILAVSNQEVGGRAYTMVNIGFRVYRASGTRVDKIGSYVGFSEAFDEWIAWYSPRIAPFETKTIKNEDEHEMDEGIDDAYFQPEEGFNKVYAVPRIMQCTSKLYIHLINLFGNLGGFDLVLDLLTNAEMTETHENNSLDITSMGVLSQVLTLPHVVFHRDFVQKYGEQIAKSIQDRLLQASDKSLREVRQDQIDGILRSAENIQKRFKTKEDRERQSELLRLELSLKQLSSNFLERRINGIKDLNTLIKNNTLFKSSDTFTADFLIQWLKEHNVFDTIWNPRKTHLELVKRSNDIFRLLAKEDELKPDLLGMLWELAKSEYKTEVLKFIGDVSAFMSAESSQYFCTAITQSPMEELTSADFDFICEFGKFAKTKEIQEFVTSFFFKCIQEENIKEDLANMAIKKFTEMTFFSTLESKQTTFCQLVEAVQAAGGGNAAIPTIRLFFKMAKDQKERVVYSSYEPPKQESTGAQGNTGAASMGAENGTTGEWGPNALTTGTYRYNWSSTQLEVNEVSQDKDQSSGGMINTATGPKTAAEENIQNWVKNSEETNKEDNDPVQASQGVSNPPPVPEPLDLNALAGESEKKLPLKLKDVIEQLETEKDLIKVILGSLEQYMTIVKTTYDSKPEKFTNQNREKIIITRYSHHIEIEDRLKLLTLLVTIVDFKINKAQLRVIYDLLQSSPILSDPNYFLYWCRNTCKEQSIISQVFDLTDIGSFFTELITSKQLDLVHLPLVGYLMIQDYFVMVNESEHNLMKLRRPEKGSKIITYNYGMSTSTFSKPRKQVDPDTLVPLIRVYCRTEDLSQIQLLWTVVLAAEEPNVFERAVEFLVTLHTSIEQDSYDMVPEIIDNAIEKCINLLKQDDPSPAFVTRVIKILQKLIQETEKKGTQNVVPHSAILNGECLERIIIRNETKQSAANLVVKVMTSASVWEFVQEVAYMLDLAPQFVKLKFFHYKRTILESDYGKTLQDLGLKNGDVITAKICEELIPLTSECELINLQTGGFVEHAYAALSSLFDLYKDDAGEYMTPSSTVFFIRGSTGDTCHEKDQRIDQLFATYNKAQDGKLTRDEFMYFYLDAAKQRPYIIYSNLKMHFFRADLVKLRDTFQSNPLSKFQMPRYTMSAREDVFSAFLEMLDRNDESSQEVWNLIRMLSTNQKMFESVLKVDTMRDPDGKINWKALLDNPSIYRKVYNFEIIEALLEENITLADSKRIQFVEQNKPYDLIGFKNPIPIRPAGHGVAPIEEGQENLEVDFNDQAAKEMWTRAFIVEGGFQSVVEGLLMYDLEHLDFNNPQVNSRIFELKNVGFMLTMLKLFLIAAFQANSSANFSLEDYHNGDPQDEGAKQFTTTQKLLKGEKGIELVQSIDMASLQTKLLTIITKIISEKRAGEMLEEKLIIENALSIWAACILFQPHLFRTFTERIFEGDDSVKTAEDFILTGLLFCKVEKIRISFRVVLSELIKRLPREESFALNWILHLLGSKFQLISSYPSRQFFDLFDEVIDAFYAQEEQSRESFDTEQLLGKLIDKIRVDKAAAKVRAIAAAKQDSIQEEDLVQQEATLEKERLMVGLIDLCRKVFEKTDRAISEKVVADCDLMNFVWKEFLFSSVFSVESESADEDKVHQRVHSRKQKAAGSSGLGPQARQAAYMLLRAIIGRSAVLMEQFIQEQLHVLIGLIEKPKGWRYSPTNSYYSSDTIQKYCGIRNLGCICYMNSMMQQFFMIPAFRYNLLCVDDGLPAIPGKHKSLEIADDNMLHQLQKLIAHLELSERFEYNPTEFCFSFKEFNGDPTNTGEQKDAQEFLNVLFERLENHLKPTKRKYLTQSIFGGKTITQLVCKCGKVKNRTEDFYNLSLNIKGVTTVAESLEQLIKGEEISDFLCEGCKKKVDISKRLLISETPNVLIVHLQRIVFSFDTFQNCKVNTLMEFPQVLDLKPYSYYEVMKREGLLKGKKIQEGEEDAAEKPEEEEKKDEDEEEEAEPVEDDCYEYKLVGMNIHSGTANAGHYWSYINTERANEEDNNEQWLNNTGAQPWQEFNDSRVSDWNFNKVKEDCFGDEVGTQGYTSQFGGTYGKSAYMLFYERAKKKPIKILVPEDELENAKEAESKVDRVVHYDEEKKEHYKLVPYSQGLDTEAKANPIYSQVSSDNRKYTFETDVYSDTFFTFIKSVLDSVIELGEKPGEEDLSSVRGVALAMAKKTLFDILVRSSDNLVLRVLVGSIIKLLQQDPQTAINFLEGLMENQAEALLECVLECMERSTREVMAFLLKFLLAHVALIEKDKILSDEQEEESKAIYNSAGELIHTYKVMRPASVFVRSMNHLVSLLNKKVASCWLRMEEYLDVIYSVGVFTPEQILESGAGFTHFQIQPESDSFKIGMHYFFSISMIEKIGDFVLGEKSPFKKESEYRPSMGSSYTPADFRFMLKLFNTMMAQGDYLDKFPLSEEAKGMFTKKEMLSVLFEPTASGKPNPMLVNMCHENEKMTKKVAKNLLQKINQQTDPEKLTPFLRALKKFLRIDDSLKRQRIEWVFGVPQPTFRRNFHVAGQYKTQKESLDMISDEAYTYQSALLSYTQSDAFLTKVLMCRNKLDTFCLKGVKELISLIVKDDMIAHYIFMMPAPTLQMNRYIDWFDAYLNSKAIEQLKIAHTNYSYKEQRQHALDKSFANLPAFNKKIQQFKDEAAAEMTDKLQNAFTGIKDHWLAGRHEDVPAHFPPRYIVGPVVGQSSKVILSAEDEHVKVELLELECEWMFSNPTGKFNLSLSEYGARDDQFQISTYEQWLENRRSQQVYEHIQQFTAQKQAAEDKAREEGKEAPNMTMPPISVPEIKMDVRRWQEHHLVGPVLATLHITSKSVDPASRVRVNANVEFDESDGPKNMRVFNTPASQIIFHNDNRPVRFFLKDDPSSAVWGPCKLSFTSESLTPTATNYSSPAAANPYASASSGPIYSYGGNATSAGGMGIASSTGNYQHSIATSTMEQGIGPVQGGYAPEKTADGKIICRGNNGMCHELNDEGMDYCNKCGEPLKE